ncbi:MAG TPA: hypothetical protein VNY06_04565, partial [Methylocella sp.]|nr:hypothetical protein [Methylocella sp.]
VLRNESFTDVLGQTDRGRFSGVARSERLDGREVSALWSRRAALVAASACRRIGGLERGTGGAALFIGGPGRNAGSGF